MGLEFYFNCFNSTFKLTEKVRYVFNFFFIVPTIGCSLGYANQLNTIGHCLLINFKVFVDIFLNICYVQFSMHSSDGCMAFIKAGFLMVTKVGDTCVM